MRKMHQRLRWILSAALAISLGTAGCGDDDGCCYVDDLTHSAAFLGAGPHPVGVRTIELSDRLVDVLYPAAPGSNAGIEAATYNQTEPFDSLIRTFIENLARRNGVDLVYEMEAFRDLPVATGQKFPVLLFSHGFGGWRTVNSSLLAGIASWGFIVASVDHLERGLNAVATGMVQADLATDRAVLLQTLQRLEDEHRLEGGPFHKRIDLDRVAVAGHSAGGAAALSLLDDDRIDTVVGYASVGSVADAPNKPVLLVSAAEDIVVTPSFTDQLFATLAAPKRSVVIANAGHNSFTDTCLELRRGNSLTQLARAAGFPIDEQLLRLGENGCAADDLAPETVWAITQHFTVAHLRSAFRMDFLVAGLGSGVVDDLPAEVEYVDIRE